MANTRIHKIVNEDITFATGDLLRASNVPKGAFAVEARATTGNVVAFNFCPKLRGAWWDDNGTWTDLTTNVSERGLTNFAEIDSFHTTQDSFYVGCDVPFQGVYINIKAPNGTASVVTWSYRKSDDTWADTGDTDGTASGGATLAIDNSVTWTMPTDWIPCNLRDVAATASAPAGSYYWVKMNVSATLDSDTQVAEIIPLPAGNSLATVAALGHTIPIVQTTATQAERWFFDQGSVGGICYRGANTNTARFEWLCGYYAGIVAE